MNIEKLTKLLTDYNERVVANYYCTGDNGNVIERYKYYNVTRRIACAAVNYSGLIFTGIRHYSVDMCLTIDLIGNELLEQWMQHRQCTQPIQGFVDQWGVFLTRQEAWVIARAAGQIDLTQYRRRVSENINSYDDLPMENTLYSEDYV